MGIHITPWARKTIKQIKNLGESLGYITAEDEMRITRGWVDVSWKWRIPILDDPLFLLVAEVETSKSDWVRIRSNAAKAVELKPLIYAHIFHPSVRLTNEERSQLLAIHQGRHTLIYDGSMDFQGFMKKLAKFDQTYLSRTLFAFCFVKAIGNSLHLRKSLKKIAGAAVLYEILGAFDLLLVFPAQSLMQLNQIVQKVRDIEGIRETSTIVGIRHLTMPEEDTKRKREDVPI